MNFPNQLSSLVPHVHILAGLYCYGTAQYGPAERHFAAAAGAHEGAEGPRTAADILRACALLAMVR